MEMLKVSFWNNNNPFCEVANKLNDLIPCAGEVEQPRKNRALEKFRKAQNAYYDLYNNGLINRTHEFRTVFGLASSKYKTMTHRGPKFDNSIYHDVEPILERIIVAACEEQGIAIAIKESK